MEKERQTESMIVNQFVIFCELNRILLSRKRFYMYRDILIDKISLNNIKRIGEITVTKD